MEEIIKKVQGVDIKFKSPFIKSSDSDTIYFDISFTIDNKKTNQQSKMINYDIFNNAELAENFYKNYIIYLENALKKSDNYMVKLIDYIYFIDFSFNEKIEFRSKLYDYTIKFDLQIKMD